MGLRPWKSLFFWILLLCLGCLWLQSVKASDEYSGEIECYFCRGKYPNSTCAQPEEDDLDYPEESGITTDVCKRGACVKIVKKDRKTGSMMIERTCTYKLDEFNLIMADVCRYESSGNGYLCMCGGDFCNHGNSITTSVVTMVISTMLTYTLLL